MYDVRAISNNTHRFKSFLTQVVRITLFSTIPLRAAKVRLRDIGIIKNNGVVAGLFLRQPLVSVNELKSTVFC